MGESLVYFYRSDTFVSAPYYSKCYCSVHRFAKRKSNLKERVHQGILTVRLTHLVLRLRRCHQLSFDYRCPYDKDAPTVWGPGDLNKMFERITTEPFYIENYQPNILSQPPDGPWIVTMENVATEEECKTMIDLGAARGYERSQDVGEK